MTSVSSVTSCRLMTVGLLVAPIRMVRAVMVEEELIEDGLSSRGLKRDQPTEAVAERHCSSGALSDSDQIRALVVDAVARTLRAAVGSASAVHDVNLEVLGQQMGER